jgi:hypothetical protein
MAKVTITATAPGTKIDGKAYTRMLAIQNQQTDTDFFLNFADSVSVAGASDAGIMIARAKSSTEPTTLLIGAGQTQNLASTSFHIISNNGDKDLIIIQS